MLYVTTRSSRDAFTVSRVLKYSPADGGLYVPLRLQPLEKEQISALMEQGFAGCCAEILNLFFSTKLTALDIDFCVGKNLCATHVLNHRIAVAELWHNQQRSFEWIVTRLFARLQDAVMVSEAPGEWVWLSVRIAALFGAFSELHRSGSLESGQKLDIAVAADDLSQAVAAWYARFLGLPVGRILCACGSMPGLWSLINYGQTRKDRAPADLERLIYLTLGHEEAGRFFRDRSYALSPEQTEKVRSGLFAAVVGTQRIGSIVPSVWRSADYLLDPRASLAYGCIQDFRAQTGEIRPTLILSETSPSNCTEEIAKWVGISAEQLKKQFRLE